MERRVFNNGWVGACDYCRRRETRAHDCVQKSGDTIESLVQRLLCERCMMRAHNCVWKSGDMIEPFGMTLVHEVLHYFAEEWR